MSEPEKTKEAIGLPPDLEKESSAGHPKVGAVVLKHADSNDADEALRAFADGEVITLTPEEEKRLLRKIDFNLMPLLCLVYGLNYLDKTTLSYASIMGLKVRRDPSSPPFSWAVSLEA